MTTLFSSLAKFEVPAALPISSHAAADDALQTAAHQLIALHHRLQEPLAALNLDLYVAQRGGVPSVNTHSAAAIKAGDALVLQYLRQPAQAVVVERLMGREEIANIHTIDPRRHPVIELRLSPRHFAVELVLSPDAWWDQQNLVGKLSVPRHRHRLYQQLQSLTPHYRMGFWQGTHLSEMHLSAYQFQHPPVMDQWQSTFEAGTDWWRLGVWYAIDDVALAEEALLETITTQMGRLYPIYEEMMWTSDNNFRDFYDQG